MTQHRLVKAYNTLISSNLPDIVRFARQRELLEMEAKGQDLAALQSVEEPQMYPFLLSARTENRDLPDLVRFAREREETLPPRSEDYYLTHWDGLSSSSSDHMNYIYHHAEPLMPLRGRDLDVMDGFFSHEDLKDLIR